MSVAACKHGVGAFQPCRECDDETDKAAIIAERDEARVMADKLTAELAACAAVLPGVYYMDPPDGGDVSVSEQLRRMAKDAERYRLLRRKFAIISDGEGHAEFCALNLPRPTYIAPSSAIELDTALDRERLGLDGVRPPSNGCENMRSMTPSVRANPDTIFRVAAVTTNS